MAENLGLASGKYRIQTEFIIDKQGNVVDVKVRAPHIKLKKEAKKLVQLFPKFTPGKMQTKPVKVKYNLPITFMIQ
ncbi:energy transducer TonB [Lutibacter sp. Hel_I_33_5]|uniref:energy transducer TonB n=1 Tax=Lutibacter sp. Hel_I_33_5 TaxID=1566289 RepID=UPI0011A6AA2E|nr:energy transducer TonB [Lutibacter sp. Hel_I_33_5]